MGNSQPITRAEAARKYDVSRQYVSQLVKQGKLTLCQDGKLDTEELGRFFGVENLPDEELDYTEARRLKTIAEARIKELELEQMRRDVISLSDAKAAVEELIVPLNRFLDDLPTNLKAHYQEIPIEAVEWLSGEINRMKQSLQDYEW